MEDFSKSIEISMMDTKSIGEKVGGWWKEVSVQSGTAATPGKLYAIGNYLLELVKNSLGDGKSDGKVTANFDDEKIWIVVENFGSEEKDFNPNISGDYGFKEVVEYADELEIESNGKFFEKDRRNNMEHTDDSDLRNGNKITFVKYIVAPPKEEAEETFRGRDFNDRM